MSRSRRKTPISGWTGSASEKEYKQAAHRRCRRAVAMALLNHEEICDAGFQHSERSYFDVWMAPKDGKQYFGDMFHDHRNPPHWRHETRHEIATRLMRK